MTSTRNPKMKCGIVALARWMAVLSVVVACAAEGQQVDVAHKSAMSSTAIPGALRVDEVSPSFLPAVFYGSGGEPAGSVVIADVNRDGKPDIIVADDCAIGTAFCSPEGSVGVLLGNGDGTFKGVVTYSSGGNGSFASQAAVVDVNGDGKPDILVSSYCSVSTCLNGTVGVLLGNGDGTFQPAVITEIAGDASSLAVVDVNRDGKPDLLVTIPSSGDVAVLLGNGDGTFQSAVSYATGGPSATWVSVSDLNGDGKPDLVVGNQWQTQNALNTLGVLLGNGDGTFQPAVSYVLNGGPSPIAISLGDLNGDGKPDIIVSEGVPAGGFLGPASVDVLLGNGDGTFKSAVTYNAGGRGPGGVVLADVNGDGTPDVVVGNECPAEGTICGESLPGVVSVLFGNGDGTLQAAITYQVGGFGALSTGSASPVAAADLNGDGLVDIVATECITFACDPVDGGGSEVGIMLHVGTKATTTTLTSTPNPSIFWQPVTFTSSVKSASGTPTGTVTFFNDSTELGSATLVSGKGFISYFALAPGAQPIRAVYGGSEKYGSSTSTSLPQAVNPAATATSLASSRNPAPPNAFVTYTAAVASQFGGGITGTIAFRDAGTVVATVGLRSNAASYRTTYPIGGLHSITAIYSGDAGNLSSPSPILTEHIQTLTSTKLFSSLNPSIYGQEITWTATVTTSGSVPPTGKVNFKWDGGLYSFGSATLNSAGIATLAKSLANADSYALTAVYSGDANNLSSTSTALNQVITQATSGATLTSSPNPSTQGQAVTFTATITSPIVKPTGPVTFTVGKKILGTAQLSGGKAKFTISALSVGTTTVTATYQGDSNIAGTSASLTQTVQQ
jgi:Bacterial Ig-like domain (group 3)/FG-GAP-like repeat